MFNNNYSKESEIEHRHMTYYALVEFVFLSQEKRKMPTTKTKRKKTNKNKETNKQKHW